ncbi:GntR family transcriptional regulator [Nonomuraea fuscirosea]|uniref:FadR/GntR family transcriptional regulator n=1 Tax=Nonomuraea fuscirosea TaxID=1291556 RepID=UPI00379F0D41
MIRELGKGARMPPERELAERLGVSRGALRDRLRLLEGFGVLSRRQGSGTYVRRLAPEGLEFALDLALSASHLSIESLHSVRVALERQAARKAALRAVAALRPPAVQYKICSTFDSSPAHGSIGAVIAALHREGPARRAVPVLAAQPELVAGAGTVRPGRYGRGGACATGGAGRDAPRVGCPGRPRPAP